MSNFRRMVVGDIQKCIPLLEEFFYKSKLPQIGVFNSDRVKEVLYSLIDKDTFFGTVVEEDGEIIGLITAYETPNLFSSGSICAELVWYIKEGERKYKDGLKLFAMMLNWAKSRKCAIVQAGGAEGYSNIEKFYEKLGFIKVDSTYWGVL